MNLQQVFSHYNRDTRPPDPGYAFCPRCRAALHLQEIAGKTRPVCAQCGFVQYCNPLPVIVFMIIEGERVLLGKRACEPGLGKWAVPSGHIEYEEDFLTTARREAREETNLEVEITGIVNVVTSFYAPGYHYLSIYVTARAVGGSLIPADDLAEAAWFPISGPLPDLAFREDIETLAFVARYGFESLRVDARFARSSVPS